MFGILPTFFDTASKTPCTSAAALSFGSRVTTLIDGLKLKVCFRPLNCPANLRGGAEWDFGGYGAPKAGLALELGRACVEKKPLPAWPKEEKTTPRELPFISLLFFSRPAHESRVLNLSKECWHGGYRPFLSPAVKAEKIFLPNTQRNARQHGPALRKADSFFRLSSIQALRGCS